MMRQKGPRGSATRSGGTWRRCTESGTRSFRATQLWRNSLRATVDGLVVGPAEEAVSHSGNVVADHSMSRLALVLLPVGVGQPLRMVQKERKQFTDHPRGPHPVFAQQR